MKLTIDTSEKTLSHESNGKRSRIPLFTKEAFELISKQWVEIGWNQKYPYTFSWMGRPVIQLPEDMIRIQEAIYRIQPDVIIETGVAHGGSLIYYATLCKAMEKGRIIGIDIEIRPHNRKAIESHALFPFITLIEGSSTDRIVVEKVKSLVNSGETVMVVLDSNHSKQHVLSELEAYHHLVSQGSYIVATDGVMKDLDKVPRGQSDWSWNHPTAAAVEFSKKHEEFIIEQPEWPFNESELTENVTHWPSAWLKRL